MTAALEGGEWSESRPGRNLPPGKEPVPILPEAGWAPGPVCMGGKSHPYPGKDSVPILQEAGWAPGPVWTGGKSRPHRDSIPDHPARSQSLYRLSYQAHVSSNSPT